MRRNAILATLALMAMVACGGKGTTSKLSGNVPEGEDLVVRIGDPETGETIAIPAGEFTIDIPANKAVPVYIMSGESMACMPFVADGSDLKLNFDKMYKVTSDSPEALTSKLQDYNDQMNKLADEFYDKVSANKDMTEEEKEKLSDEVQAKMDEISKKIFEENKDNYLGKEAVMNLYFSKSPEEVEAMVKELAPEVAANEDLQKILKSLDAQKATAEGAKFTDFEVEQPDGTKAKLSDYVGQGKYMLVDFWASWCGPCRAEIPNIKDVYEKYHGEDFDVLSVAVWDKVEDTQKALEEEQLPWPQIINAQKVPTDIYGINGIPHIILFGPDGTILHRELRGKAIDETVGKYIKK